MRYKKEPLYRKVNTKARGIHHLFGGDYKHNRNTKKESRERDLGSMHGSQKRGLDYTPLFKFLISKVGQKWDEVHSEAISRLDRSDPIYWLVAIEESDKKEIVRIGESSYFSGLFVDSEGVLQLV
ncbi:MAG: hypothetical protein VXY56_02260, partial [Pseudomonadota bacterium]|nr:hypothetical protein [Pseudomonadota bacterium]